MCDTWKKGDGNTDQFSHIKYCSHHWLQSYPLILPPGQQTLLISTDIKELPQSTHWKWIPGRLLHFLLVGGWCNRSSLCHLLVSFVSSQKLVFYTSLLLLPPADDSTQPSLFTQMKNWNKAWCLFSVKKHFKVFFHSFFTALRTTLASVTFSQLFAGKSSLQFPICHFHLPISFSFLLFFFFLWNFNPNLTLSAYISK